MGYPLPDRAAAGRCIYSKRVEILVKNQKKQLFSEKRSGLHVQNLNKMYKQRGAVWQKNHKKKRGCRIKKGGLPQLIHC
jgi:hypothetical protein